MVDPYVASTIAAKERPSVVKTKLLNLRSKYPTGMIFAIEGIDDKIVYSKWIGKVSPDLSYEFLVCGGKKQVRNLRNALSRDRNNLENMVKMIVDRDFDDLKDFGTNDRVFMLDRYSIENYVVDPEVVDGVLSVAYPCHGEAEIRQVIVAKFKKDYDDYLRASKDVNLRIFIARKCNVDIDDVVPSGVGDIVEIELDNVARKDHDPEQIIPFDASISDDVHAKLVTEFNNFEPSVRYRGKFAYRFFSKWLDRLASEFRNPKKNLFGNLNVDASINHGEISIGGHASKSPIPHGFADFIHDLR